VNWREQFGHLARTIDTVFPEERELEELLALGRPLRVKLGLDLTSPSVTIGNEIPLRILGRFQELGHVPVLILGDFTTLVGDPSGRDKTRPTLTPEQVDENSATWLDQIGKVLDVEKAEVRRNSEWLGELTPHEILRLAGQLTVAQMLERDSFSKRYAAGTPIHLHEFLYCLFQGYDSIAVESDIELGGTDQTFNINMGRTLQKNAGLRSQVCITNHLLEGIDGNKKMSKSLGNAISIDTPPKDYFRLATDVEDEEIEKILAGDIWTAKKKMAGAITARHYGADAALHEHREFERVFKKKELPAEIPEYAVGPGKHVLLDLLRGAFDFSSGEAKRLVKQGAVSLEGGKLDDPQAEVEVKGGEVLKAGKRRFARLV
jgi:tyrosyl-tRNA synthetase